MIDLESIVKPYTMASEERIHLLATLAGRVEKEHIPGDMVECGVCNGGSAAILAYFAKAHNRKIWLFDSFEGLPPITKEDTDSVDGTSSESCVGQCCGRIETVKEILGLVGADMNRVRIVKGWFLDTFPLVSIPQIAMLNLDSDWYESEKICLQKFYDSVTNLGFVYFDDFYYWPGCQKAAIEFFSSKEEPTPRFNRVGHSMWLQKGIL